MKDTEKPSEEKINLAKAFMDREHLKYVMNFPEREFIHENDPSLSLTENDDFALWSLEIKGKK